MLATIPEANTYVDDIFGADDKIAVRSCINGTHLGELLGPNPRDRVIEETNHETYRFEGGRLANEWI